MGDIKKPWRKACKEAGYPDKLFHDFRRTAARNFIRAGVSESVAIFIANLVQKQKKDLQPKL